MFSYIYIQVTYLFICMHRYIKLFVHASNTSSPHVLHARIMDQADALAQFPKCFRTLFPSFGKSSSIARSSSGGVDGLFRAVPLSGRRRKGLQFRRTTPRRYNRGAPRAATSQRAGEYTTYPLRTQASVAAFYLPLLFPPQQLPLLCSSDSSGQCPFLLMFTLPVGATSTAEGGPLLILHLMWVRGLVGRRVSVGVQANLLTRRIQAKTQDKSLALTDEVRGSFLQGNAPSVKFAYVYPHA